MYNKQITPNTHGFLDSLGFVLYEHCFYDIEIGLAYLTVVIFDLF